MVAGITIDAKGLAEAIYNVEGGPPWHNLGQMTTGRVTAKECLQPAEDGGGGLNWKVIQEVMGRFRHGLERFKVYLEDPQNYFQEYGNPWAPMVDTENVPSVKANVRQDTGLYLGNVTAQYQVVQNEEGFSFMDDLVESGEMEYEAAFSLFGGKKVCMLGRMPGVDTIAPNDHVLRYVLMTLCHDGSGSIKFGPTAVRVVCANTYALAIDQQGNKIKDLTIRHSGNMGEKLDEARAILAESSTHFAEHTAMSQELAKRILTVSEFTQFLDIVRPEIPKNHPDYTERRAQKVADVRAAISSEFGNARQDTAPGSAWSAFNAVTYHVDHLPRRGADDTGRAQARFAETMDPTRSGYRLKMFAFRTACKIAGVETAQSA
jgi:phage/plasmid-like protein (TIGR03299 family)